MRWVIGFRLFTLAVSVVIVQENAERGGLVIPLAPSGGDRYAS